MGGNECNSVFDPYLKCVCVGGLGDVHVYAADPIILFCEAKQFESHWKYDSVVVTFCWLSCLATCDYRRIWFVLNVAGAFSRQCEC